MYKIDINIMDEYLEMVETTKVAVNNAKKNRLNRNNIYDLVYNNKLIDQLLANDVQADDNIKVGLELLKEQINGVMSTISDLDIKDALSRKSKKRESIRDEKYADREHLDKIRKHEHSIKFITICVTLAMVLLTMIFLNNGRLYAFSITVIFGMFMMLILNNIFTVYKNEVKAINMYDRVCGVRQLSRFAIMKAPCTNDRMLISDLVTRMIKESGLKKIDAAAQLELEAIRMFQK